MKTFFLFRISGSRTLLEWAPHAIYHLVSSGMEEQFLATLKRYQAKFYLMVGGKTPLDRSYQALFSKAGNEISYASGPYAERTGEFFSVIGDFIIRIRPEKEFLRRLDEAFHTASNMSVEQAARLSQLLNSPVRVRVELERSRAKTQAIHKHFRQFFGKIS